MKIKVKVEEGVTLPEFGSEQAVGFDITATKIKAIYKGNKEVKLEILTKIQEQFERDGYFSLRPFERVLIGAGLYFDLDPAMELQVRPRSGLALKRGLTVFNSPGTIDPDYRGEAGVIIINTTPFLNRINKGERIAQLVPKLVLKAEFIQVEEVSDTARGAGGFGHTGE